jgi:hypothetical protein
VPGGATFAKVLARLDCGYECGSSCGFAARLLARAFRFEFLAVAAIGDWKIQ